MVKWDIGELVRETVWLVRRLKSIAAVSRTISCQQRIILHFTYFCDFDQTWKLW